MIDVPVSTIMTSELVTVNVDDGLDKAEHLLKKHRIRHIPVVEGKKIVGMLSMNDILRISFADGAYREETWHLRMTHWAMNHFDMRCQNI